MGARGNTLRLRLGTTCALLLACALAFAACGNHHTRSNPLIHSDGGLQSTDSVLLELDALQCPESVEPTLWNELKGALAEALLSAGSAGVPPVIQEVGRRDACPTKFSSTPPTGEANRVNDLAIADNGDSSFRLSWHYRNLGDYDQDGVVALEDIYPLAEHFGEIVPETDAERNSLQAVIDGSGNGKVGIEDVTPIAQHYQTDVDHYVIEGAEAQAGPWELVAEVAQDTGIGEGRLEYECILSGAANLWYRVAPYDAEGTAGEASNAVLRPSNEPIIYEAGPTSGYQHEEYTFTATVTGAAPLAYAWDFGGGASPDVSSAVSPAVTLADAGEYSASLTVTNAYGEASFPFTLIVDERDMWAHTWGGSGTESISSLAVDGTGALWAAGFTTSFGGESEVLLLSFDSTGAAEWAKTWGGEGYEGACSVRLMADNQLRVIGSTTTYGVGNDDILLLKYYTSGDLVWSKTWGTAAYERAVSMAVDTDGSMYVCGSYLEWGGKDDILLCKFDAEGVIQWAVTWGGADYDYGRDVLVLPDAVYVAGSTYSFGAGDGDGLLLKYGPDGELVWAVTFGGADSDGASSIAAAQGSIYLAAGTRSFGQGNFDALLVKFDGDSSLLWARTWGDSRWQTTTALIADGSQSLIAAGSTASFSGGYRDALVLGLDTEGNLLWSKTWGGENENRAYAVTSNTAGDMYIGGIAPAAWGAWVDVEGVFSEAELDVGFPEAATKPIAGTQSTPEGIETSPEGTTDSGGGGDDTLVLKNYPR